MRAHDQTDRLAEGIPSNPQTTGKQQIMVFCWNQKLCLFNGSELFPRPVAASPAVPSMRKAIAVCCTGPRKRYLSQLTNKLAGGITFNVRSLR